MKVAVPWCQHSPMLGQWASSQTVLSFSSCMMPFRRTKFCEPGALTFNHSGLGSRGPMNWTGASTGMPLPSVAEGGGPPEGGPLHTIGANAAAGHHLARALHLPDSH